MRITLADDRAIRDWKHAIENERVRFREACTSFARDGIELVEYEVSETTQIDDLIHRHVGERPRTYSYEELCEVEFDPQRPLSPAGLATVRARAASLAEELPTVYLRGARDYERLWHGGIADTPVADGDVLLVRRTSRLDLLRQACSALHPKTQGMGPVRSADAFFHAVVDRSLEHRSPLPRQRVALLYTDEDVDVASYVRTHHDELDAASGRDCDLIFIENPGAIAPVKFWRPLLGAKLHAVWKLLGWADSVPYDKAAAYQIAKELGVSFDRLPCAVVLAPGSTRVLDIVSLAGDLTRTLRGLLARFQTPRTRARRATSPGSTEAPREPAVFLSHASADKELVRAVAVQLQSLGIETWLDEQQLRAGESLTARIEHGLAGAAVVALFLSRRALASRWVEAEMRAALHAQIEDKRYRAIIPVVLDDCEVPLLLADYRRIEAADPASIVKELAAVVAPGA